MNYTKPGRFHLIINRQMIYVSFWFYGKRYHYGPKLGDGLVDFNGPPTIRI